MIPPKYLAAMEAVKYLLALCIVLACATGGVAGAGLLVLIVAGYGCKLYTWPPIRDHYAAKREREERCRHEWGPPVEVAKSLYGYGTRFYKAFCARCGKQKDVNADGTNYVPWNERHHDDK